MSERRKLTGDHNQCPTCAEYFNSTAAFDKHRVQVSAVKGETFPRRCRTEAEMFAAGMDRNAGGWWITARNPEFVRQQ